MEPIRMGVDADVVDLTKIPVLARVNDGKMDAVADMEMFPAKESRTETANEDPELKVSVTEEVTAEEPDKKESSEEAVAKAMGILPPWIDREALRPSAKGSEEGVVGEASGEVQDQAANTSRERTPAKKVTGIIQTVITALVGRRRGTRAAVAVELSAASPSSSSSRSALRVFPTLRHSKGRLTADADSRAPTPCKSKHSSEQTAAAAEDLSRSTSIMSDVLAQLEKADEALEVYVDKTSELSEGLSSQLVEVENVVEQLRQAVDRLSQRLQQVRLAGDVHAAIQDARRHLKEAQDAALRLGPLPPVQ